MWDVLRHELMKWQLSIGRTDESVCLLKTSTESWLNAIYAELFTFRVLKGLKFRVVITHNERVFLYWILDSIWLKTARVLGKTFLTRWYVTKSKATLVKSHSRTFIHCSRKYIQDWLTLVIDIYLRESFDCYVQSQATLCPLHLSCQWKCCVALSRTTQPLWQFSRSLTWFFFREATGTVFCHITAQGPALLFVLHSRTATHLLRFLEPICSNLW